MAEAPRTLDGNAAAGRLADVFVFDATIVRSTCTGCGATAALAEHRLYADAPGMILRCPSCDAAVVRLAQTPGRTWLDLRGAALLEIPDVMSADSPQADGRPGPSPPGLG